MTTAFMPGYLTDGERDRRTSPASVRAIHRRPHRRARPARPPAADLAARAAPTAARDETRRPRLPGPRPPAPRPRLRLLDPRGAGDARVRAAGPRGRLRDQRPCVGALRRALRHLARLPRLCG